MPAAAAPLWIATSSTSLGNWAPATPLGAANASKPNWLNSESTSRILPSVSIAPRARRGDQTWKTFLQNHAKDLAAVDCLVVPTATFRVLWVFLVLAHARRKVLHFNITDSPSAAWRAQQLTEAFAYAQPPRYLLRDRDGIYGWEFVRRTLGLGLEQKLIAPRSPRQNPFVERLIGCIRRECLDHLIVLHESHLRRRLTDYFYYYHLHRTHRSLAEDCPEPRAAEPPDQGNLIALPMVSVASIIVTLAKRPPEAALTQLHFTALRPGVHHSGPIAPNASLWRLVRPAKPHNPTWLSACSD